MVRDGSCDSKNEQCRWIILYWTPAVLGFLPKAESKEKHGVWAHSRVESTLTHLPWATLYFRVDFIPQSGTLNLASGFSKGPTGRVPSVLNQGGKNRFPFQSS